MRKKLATVTAHRELTMSSWWPKWSQPAMTEPWLSSDLAMTELWSYWRCRDWAVTVRAVTSPWPLLAMTKPWSLGPGAVTTVVTVSSPWPFIFSWDANNNGMCCCLWGSNLCRLPNSGSTRSRPNQIAGPGPKSGPARKSESRGPENGVSRWRRPNSEIYSQNHHFGLVYEMIYQFLGMETKNYKFGMFCQQCHPSVASGDADIRPRNASRIPTCHLFTS